MKLRKYETIRLLYKGKSRILTCIFNENLNGKIPIYTCRNISNIQIIRLKTDEILVLINNDYYDTLKRYRSSKQNDRRDMLEIYTMYSIMTERYGDNTRKDICLAYWYGFKKIINMIQNQELGEYTRERVKALEDEIVNSKLYKSIPSKQSYIDKLKFIEVINGMETQACVS